MSIPICETHKVPMLAQYVRNGKEVYTCTACENERMAKLVDIYPVRGFYESFEERESLASEYCCNDPRCPTSGPPYKKAADNA